MLESSLCYAKKNNERGDKLLHLQKIIHCSFTLKLIVKIRFLRYMSYHITTLEIRNKYGIHK